MNGPNNQVVQLVQAHVNLQRAVRLQHNQVALYVHLRQRVGLRRHRRFWVRPWLLRRPVFGHHDSLLAELRLEDLQAFRNYIRMEPALFDELLVRVTPLIEKETTFFRSPISPALKLSLTLRYLATGDSYASMQYNFRVAKNTICLFIPVVCEAIYAAYKQEVLKCPDNPQDWKQKEQVFAQRWNFPHAVGALDGKHVSIRCPTNSGSLYYNYKGFYSVVMLALVDGDYQFMWVDVGCNGSCSDAQIFNGSDLKAAVDGATLGLPAADELPGDDRPTPYFMLADDAFSLKTWLMKPFSGRHLEEEESIFNYRLSRARRVVENAFGILANRFRCLLTTMAQAPPTVISVILACVTLHNILRRRYREVHQDLLDREDDQHRLIRGAWRNDQELANLNLQVRGGNAASQAGKRQRIYLRHYVNSVAGSVAWQREMI